MNLIRILNTAFISALYKREGSQISEIIVCVVKVAGYPFFMNINEQTYFVIEY